MFEFVKDYWTVVWEFLLDSNRAAAMGILLTILAMFMAGIFWFFGLFKKRDKTLDEIASANGKLELTFSLEKYETHIAQKITEAEAKLQFTHDEDKAVLQSEITELRRRAGDPETSLKEARKTISKLEQALNREGNEIGAAKLAEAKDALEAGDFSLADELFAGIEAQENLAILRAARAAFARGEIAEQEVRWGDAARHYSRAVALDATAENLGRAQVLSWRSGDYETAIHFGKRRLQLHQKQDGPESANFATALNDQALSLHALARLDEAEPLFRQAIEIDKKTLGEEHPKYATRLNNLALLLQALARLDEAEPLFRQAIEIDKNTLGEEHPKYATHLNNLAGFLRDLGQFDEAEPLLRKAIEIDKKTLGEEHPQYATHLNNLAGLLQALGRFDEAEPLFRKAVEIDKKMLGEEHPEYVTDLSNLAALLEVLGRHNEAEPLFRKAIEIGKKTLGEEHPKYTACLNNHAGALRGLGQYDEAEPLYRQAIEIGKKALGEEHPDYAIRLNNLAGLLQALGRLDEAEPLYRQAVAILEGALGAEHSTTKTVRGNYEAFLAEKG